MFLKPPKERADILKYSSHTNPVVNMANVTFFSRAKEAYYPDNEGIPTILFNFVGGTTAVWYFDKGDDKLVKSTLVRLESSLPHGIGVS